MIGNVWEWVSDWQTEGSYGALTVDAQIDPEGPETGSSKIMRGGGFQDEENRLSSSARFWGTPDHAYRTIGFRICLKQI